MCAVVCILSVCILKPLITSISIAKAQSMLTIKSMVHTYSIFVDLCRLTHLTRTIWVAHPAHPHLLDFPSINSINKSKSPFENWKKLCRTLNCVVSSIYIHTQSHMIRQMSCLSSIKTNNKLDEMACRSTGVDKNGVTMYIHSIFANRHHLTASNDKNRINVDGDSIRSVQR